MCWMGVNGKRRKYVEERREKDARFVCTQHQEALKKRGTEIQSNNGDIGEGLWMVGEENNCRFESWARFGYWVGADELGWQE